MSTPPAIVRRFQDGRLGPAEHDPVVQEEPLELRVEGRTLMLTMRTPGHDEELAAGLLYTEGLIDGADDLAAMARVREPLDPQDNTLDVRLAAGVRLDPERFASAQRALYASSACGLCGRSTLRNLLRAHPPLRAPLRFAPELLLELPARMRAVQEAFERTGALHAAALFGPDGALEVLREDVGRHNAVDKVLGWRLLRDEVPVDDRVLLLSGRLGFEILQKALVARIPVVAAVGAPSSLAIALAAEAGIQLAGFVRDGRLNLYEGLGSAG